MKEFLESLLLHFFIMMIIPLVNTMYKQKRSLKGIIISSGTIYITLLLTMIFPISVSNNIHFDMKFIGVYLAFFYVSPISGVIAIMEIILFKSMTDPSNIVSNALNYGIIAILFYSTANLYKRLGVRKRLLLPFIFYIPIMVTRLMYMLDHGEYEYILHTILFIFVSMIALAGIIYLIEMNNIRVSMMEKLQNADKLNAISQLAASVAHEIRNPMTSIKGFLQLMKDERNLTTEQSSFITLSLSELDRTQKIINDFLSLARPSSNNSDTIVDASSQLHSIVDFMQPFAVISNVEIAYFIEDQLYIEGNANEFKQLGINIMKNGIEAMPSGGKLSVTASLIDKMVTIVINDSGDGMTKQQLNQLGQPYYSTKTKGTGLGLMISFDIIKKMSGKYSIDSTINKGTCFTIKFPFKTQNH